jgi:hypothetical protein
VKGNHHFHFKERSRLTASGRLGVKILAYLDQLVPAGGDNHRVRGVGAESHARNPLGVALIGDSILAVTQGVPELNCPVSSAGDNLSVVGREGNREDVIGMANKASGGGAGGKLPEAEGLVPGSGESIGAVRRDNLQAP